MKQRIRGLVSLHEIPFPLAPYKGKKAIVHIIQTEEERERRRDGEDCKNLTEYIIVFLCFPCVALHGCHPTCDIIFIQ